MKPIGDNCAQLGITTSTPQKRERSHMLYSGDSLQLDSRIHQNRIRWWDSDSLGPNSADKSTLCA